MDVQLSWDPYSIRSKRKISTSEVTGVRQIKSSRGRQRLRLRWLANEKSTLIVYLLGVTV